MTAVVYGREALRQFREHRAQLARAPERQPLLLEDLPPDVPMDGATITVWNSERFIALNKWLAAAPLTIDKRPENSPSRIPTDTACVVGACGGTQVWLVRDGERWTMFAGSRTASGRRRDFASPYLAHAIRTAEFWFGVPATGWCAERCA